MSSKLDDYKDDIKGHLGAGCTISELAITYNVARSTMSEWLKANGLAATATPRTQPIREGEVSREELLERENADLRRLRKAERSVDVQAERVMLLIEQAIQAPAPVFNPPPASGSPNSHVQALLLSDLHGGEVVDPQQVDGMNEYNWDILVERMESVHKSLLSFSAARPYPIDELHLWFLGDMCSGSNHLEIIETNEFTAADQGYRVGMLLAKFVETLVPHFPRIIVKAVPGNHPRVTVKPASKNVFNNFDWMSYMIVQTYLRGYDSVECEFPRSAFQIAEIAGLKYLLWHGDGVRSSMPGVPWGGVTRRWNQLKRQYADQGIHLDGLAIGHFHQANAVQDVLMNGSVKGVDEYSLKQFGGGEQPTQLLVTFDPERKRLTDVSYINP